MKKGGGEPVKKCGPKLTTRRCKKKMKKGTIKYATNAKKGGCKKRKEARP